MYTLALASPRGDRCHIFLNFMVSPNLRPKEAQHGQVNPQRQGVQADARRGSQEARGSPHPSQGEHEDRGSQDPRLHRCTFVVQGIPFGGVSPCFYIYIYLLYLLYYYIMFKFYGVRGNWKYQGQRGSYAGLPERFQ